MRSAYASISACMSGGVFIAERATDGRSRGACPGVYRAWIPCVSETRQLGMRQSPAPDVHAAELGATAQRRYILVRVEQILFVERALQGAEQRQFIRPELDAHLVDFLYAHAVL